VRVSFDELVARQDGVVALRQALDWGMSAATVQRRAREGSWRRLHPRVYLVGGHRLTDAARIRAAWLWAGVDATVTGPAAAYWHRILDRAPPVVDVTVPPDTKPRPRPGITIRRRDVGGPDVVLAAGIRVAAKPFATLETAVALPTGSAFLDRALQKHVAFPALYRSYCRNIGRTGGSVAAKLLIAAADRADSAAERLLVSLLRGAGITGWVLGHPFGPYLVDVAFVAERVAVEVDGWAWHVDADRFRNDRRKGNLLTRSGWMLLRFTWHDLHRRPAEVVAEIRDALSLTA
jgi:very-short-patch-repair endonuclease